MCKLRPPTALLALHGSMHQLKRLDVYRSFANKQNVVLFATDVAARGLGMFCTEMMLDLCSLICYCFSDIILKLHL